MKQTNLCASHKQRLYRSSHDKQARDRVAARLGRWTDNFHADKALFLRQERRSEACLMGSGNGCNNRVTLRSTAVSSFWVFHASQPISTSHSMTDMQGDAGVSLAKKPTTTNAAIGRKLVRRQRKKKQKASTSAVGDSVASDQVREERLNPAKHKNTQSQFSYVQKYACTIQLGSETCMHNSVMNKSHKPASYIQRTCTHDSSELKLIYSQIYNLYLIFL